MAEREHGYERGWYRYGFDTMPFIERTIHGGGADIDISLAFNRGVGKPHIAFGIIYPGRGETPAIGMHIHRDEPSGEDLEEWYVIIDGTGIQRFSNGDSVEFGPGDLIACYPGTGHSLEATGDKPVRIVSITPKMFTSRSPVLDPEPERFEPRIHVRTTDETKNPITAECSDCGAMWERPENDRGANTIATWSVEHECTRPFTPLQVGLAQAVG
jgi:mannose-6-phosphate isomerase-like protein (cupin superfamily)